MARIINEVNWKGEKYIMEWFADTNYDSLKNIHQVYGTFFDKEGKICVIGLADENNWSLPGGEVKKSENWKKELIKEAKKESDIELDEKSIVPLGYLKITPKNKDNPLGIHYLLRVAGKISKINDQKVDEAQDPLNERVFIIPEEFPRYCHWGRIGEAIIEKAKEAWINFK